MSKLDGSWNACTVVTTLAWGISAALMGLAWAIWDEGHIVTLVANTSLFFAGVGLASGRRGNIAQHEDAFRGAYELGREVGGVRNLR